MARNELNNSFHDNQYGGRKGRQPQSAILNKVLTLDIVIYHAEEAGLLDNDAKACYDMQCKDFLFYVQINYIFMEGKN